MHRKVCWVPESVGRMRRMRFAVGELGAGARGVWDVPNHPSSPEVSADRRQPQPTRPLIPTRHSRKREPRKSPSWPPVRKPVSQGLNRCFSVSRLRCGAAIAQVPAFAEMTGEGAERLGSPAASVGRLPHRYGSEEFGLGRPKQWLNPHAARSALVWDVPNRCSSPLAEHHRQRIARRRTSNGAHACPGLGRPKRPVLSRVRSADKRQPQPAPPRTLNRHSREDARLSGGS